MMVLKDSIRWESATRYYCALIGTDLFGAVVLNRCWGGKGNRLGGMATDPYETEDAARKAIEALAKVRLRHGYRLLN